MAENNRAGRKDLSAPRYRQPLQKSLKRSGAMSVYLTVCCRAIRGIGELMREHREATLASQGVNKYMADRGRTACFSLASLNLQARVEHLVGLADAARVYAKTLPKRRLEKGNEFNARASSKCRMR